MNQLFALDTLTEAEFDSKLELAEDLLDPKKNNPDWVNRTDNAQVWLNEGSKDGISLASAYAGGKGEQFAASRTLSRLKEMQSSSYWKINS